MLLQSIDEVRLNFNPASLHALNAVLAFLMFGVALDTRVEDFKRVLKMPLAMGAGIAAQFLLLPAITYCLTLLINPTPSIALGMILVACCPPGNISNIITHRAGGNVALTQPGQFITTDNGVKVIGFNNWPGRIAGASSALFARNLLTFLTTFWDKEAKAPKLPPEDEIVKGVMLTHNGAVVHPSLAPAKAA